MSPVPCMGTDSLFTKETVRLKVYAAATKKAVRASRPKSKGGNLFEYMTCEEWQGLSQVGCDSSKFMKSDVGEDYLSILDRQQQLDQASPPIPSSGEPRLQGSKERFVHLVIPDGTVQGTQLAHHLISAMLCQNTELFHPNAMQSVLAALMVYLLKQRFKWRGWRSRQLEWVAESYERAYASSSCAGAKSEHGRFETYVASLMDPDKFRLSLITDAPDHPRELRCQGLSKAVLGMWMGARSAHLRGCSVSESLLVRWRLGLISELLHRLGLALEVQVVMDCFLPAGGVMTFSVFAGSGGSRQG